MSDDVCILRSPLIPAEGFLHGWPERTGGVSTGPRASLNLGFRWGDERANVEENRRIVARVAGYDPDALVITKHAHTAITWEVGRPEPDPPEYDGLVTDKPGIVLGVFAADCMPIVFADPVARVIGACHAGWRGTVNGIAENMIDRMQELGADAQNIRVAIGPSIGPCCFEVGPEVVDEFRARYGELPGLVVDGPKKPHIDLRAAARRDLERAGVPPEHIDASPPCTMHTPDRFFSYRRDGKEGGVHMGFIALR